ncbi:hypothetical protein PHLCEN_2v6756 [Hermanssonia centrifuga]|uniref:PPIase cyclophilin-type domain-containing protein n=1 Tax=Hermanssonia centrifuga TaxID=98765 RepID=A0A2R6NYK8_9APHY|nr:hypothetical protein PHLCEN_2v6756 [Hermanssonia centrifuga]
MALPTRGRVIIDTTVGEIDVELWSKVRCRLFLYEEKIKHSLQHIKGNTKDMSEFPHPGDGRVVPNFLVQTGDKTGTGGGGESIYGEPFEDEIHPRLRFAHRGIIAMANNGTKNSNDSQFIITLDRADELHGKHTLFGRVIGDTIYNVLKIGGMEIDANERPLYPPKIKTIRIVDNPFDDIIPRITAAEKRAQLRAREQGQREREEEQRRRGAKKDVKLLSFGADEDGEEEEQVIFKKKPIVRPDLVENPEPSAAIPVAISQASKEKHSHRTTEAASKIVEPEKIRESTKVNETDITKIREKHAKEQAAQSSSRQTEIEKMEAEIRKLSRKARGDDSDDEPTKKKAKKSYLEEEMAKYAKAKGAHKKAKDGKRKDEGDVLAALSSFRSKLKGSAPDRDVPIEEPTEDQEALAGASTVGAEEDPGMEVDDDTGFLGHALHFPKDNNEEAIKAERDYEVIDPRQRGARAKEEERERKRALKPKDGGRGYRR